MCEYSERIFNGGREEERRAMIRSMEKEGIDEETIKKILENLKEEEVVQV